MNSERYPISNVVVEPRRSPGARARGIATVGVLGSAAALGGMAKAGYDYPQQFPYTQSQEDHNIMPEAVDEVEMIAEDLPSLVYERVLAARIIEASGLRRDQVLFTDSLGQQISEPFTLEESVGLSVDEMTWRYQGGRPAGIPGAWIKEQKAYISEQTGLPMSEIEMLHVYQDLSNTRFEHMNSRIEAVYENAVTPLIADAEGRDGLSIIRLETTFTQLPSQVAEEFTPYLIGIAAEESRFDANKTSERGAVGILQIMPDTALGYIEKHNVIDYDPRNLSDQLPVGIEHIETSYAELKRQLDIELNYITAMYFDGNRSSMEKYFLVPLMINSYNAGQQRMIEVVRWFLDNYPEPESTMELLDLDEIATGYDVFFIMTHQCAKENGVEKFGPDASTYVEKVMGWTSAFIEYEKKQ